MEETAGRETLGSGGKERWSQDRKKSSAPRRWA